MFFIAELGIKKRVVNKNGNYWSGTVGAECVPGGKCEHQGWESGWENLKLFQVASKEPLDR